MKFRHAIAAGVALATSAPAFAGDFQTLLSPTGSSTVAPLVVGSNNPNADRLYLETGSISFLSSDVPSVIDYNAFARVNGVRQEIGSWTLSLIDYRYTPDVKFDGQTQPIGDMYDFVYRDSRDQKLVFGTRLKLGVSETQQDDAELNFIYRYGLGSGSYNPKAAWLFTSDADLRMYTAGRTASSSLTAAATFDADTVRYQSDVNLSEGNPYSGLFLLKTDASSYSLDNDKAIGFFQAGEEGQPRVGGTYGGFVPSFAGLSQSNPVLPTIGPDGSFTFATPTGGNWFDPPLVEGFDISLQNGGAFSKLIAPEGFQNLRILVDGVQVAEVDGGETYLFGAGVSAFRIAGIAPPLDPESPGFGTAFPLYLDFSRGTETTMVWTPVPIPEPSTWAMLAGGLGLLACVTRNRSRSARAGSPA